MVCDGYYDTNSGYFNGSAIDELQTILDEEIANSIPSDADTCVDYVQRYLCYYYFPVCNLTTGVIIPTCSPSCNLLTNNQDCKALIQPATRAIEQRISNIAVGDNLNNSPGGTCLITVNSSYIENATLSMDCIAIEELINETIPLSCIPVESDDTCLPQLPPDAYYAPNTFELVGAVFGEIQTIIRQLPQSSVCRGFIGTVVCVFRFPGCNPDTGKILPICSFVCPVVDCIVDACSLEFFRNDPNFPEVNRLLDQFICRVPQTYYNFPSQYISDDSDCSLIISTASNTTDTNLIQQECIGASSPTSSPGSSSSSSSSTGIIVGVVVGVCAVIVVITIIVIVILIRKCNNGKRRDINEGPRNDYSSDPTAARYERRNGDGTVDLNNPYSPSPYLAPRKFPFQEERLSSSMGSLVCEVTQLLQYVKDKFSEVLLPAEVITKSDFLGKGAFGVVHKGELIATDGTKKAVAIKTIKSTSLDGMKDLVAETAIMKGFHHPNVLPLLGVCVDYDDDDVLKIVIPFMAHGDLKTFLKESRVSPNNTHEYPKDMSDEVLTMMCFDIAKGMTYLAGKRFIHRDLAARNCMVDESLRIRVADFGLTRDIYSTEYYRQDKHTTLPVKWMALESLLDGYFDEKTDVWSYGVTCWEIFTLGRIPYPGVDNANVSTILKTGRRLEKPELCTTTMYTLIETMWYEDSEKRPSFSVILKSLNSMLHLEEAPVNEETSIISDSDETSPYISVTA
ncbi:tyrosine-protein kinase receptor TYRO3-like isoform X2 [Dysidea avara]